MIYESQQDAQHEKKRLHTGDKKIQTRDSAVFGSGRDCSVRLHNVLYGGALQRETECSRCRQF